MTGLPTHPAAAALTDEHIEEVLDAVKAKAAPHVWDLPAEPGPEVTRLRPVERYPGDNSLLLERGPNGAGWRVVINGRPGEPLDWVQAFGLGMAQIFGGRPLIDATQEMS